MKMRISGERSEKKNGGMKNILQAGQTVKTKGSGLVSDKLDKNRKVSKPGIVLCCYEFFILVQLEHGKKCFTHDELEVISENDYQKLVLKKDKPKIKVLHHGAN